MNGGRFRIAQQLPRGAGTQSPASIYPPASLRGQERPLVMQYPLLRVAPFGFRSIPLDGTAIAASCSAWYGLKRLTPDSVGQQFFLNGYQAVLSACNVTPAADSEYAAADQAAWGTVDGTGAAIVIGTNLPVTPGAWTSGPNNVFGVELNVVDMPAVTNNIVLHFPPGKQEDAPRPALYQSTQTTPLAIMVPQGATLDVALVVRRAQVNGITKIDGIIGRVFGQLFLSGTVHNQELMQ